MEYMLILPRYDTLYIVSSNDGVFVLRNFFMHNGELFISQLSKDNVTVNPRI